MGMSSTKRYCSCEKPKPASIRIEAKWYCFRHRRHLCDNCIYDELNQRHISCLVGTYNEFIQSSPSSYANFKKNKCPMCNKILPDDDARSVVRLNCACVYHSSCLQQYLLSHPSNNVNCKKCATPIIASSQLYKKTNLSESVDKFLRSVSRQRLWSKHKKISSMSQSTQNEEKMNESNITTNVRRNAGDIVLDTTNINKRHRISVKNSLNADGNRDDDKYHKPQRKNVRYLAGTSWFTSRKLMLLILLCLMLIAQCWFIYTVF